MDYEKKYKETLERARKLQENSNGMILKKWLWNIFPELKESEDEEIRKVLEDIVLNIHDIEVAQRYGVDRSDIIAWLEKQKEFVSADFDDVWETADCNELTAPLEKYSKDAIKEMCHAWYDKGIELERKSWLEKQSKQKEYTFKSLPRLLDMIESTSKAKAYCQKLIDTLVKEGYSTDAKIVSGCLKQMNGEKVAMATMDEHMPTDKIKPKFHEGDWITNGNAIYHISNIRDDGFYCFDHDTSSDMILYIDNTCHLWSIKDATDGDVLVSELWETIILFRGIKDDNIDFYCDYDFAKISIPEDRFTINNGQHYGSVEDSIDFHPATKEQCDTLMKAMADAGYIFDFEKKELKKIC